LVLYPKFGIGNGVYHHEGHEEHEGRENHVEIRSLFLTQLSVLRTNMLENFLGLHKFSIGGTYHKERIEHKKDNFSSLRPLRSLRLNLSFTLVAASPRWVLRALRGE